MYTMLGPSGMCPNHAAKVVQMCAVCRYVQQQGMTLGMQQQVQQLILCTVAWYGCHIEDSQYSSRKTIPKVSQNAYFPSSKMSKGTRVP